MMKRIAILTIFLCAYVFSQAQEGSKIVLKGAILDSLYIKDLSGSNRFFQYSLGASNDVKTYNIDPKLNNLRLLFGCNGTVTILEVEPNTTTQIELQGDRYKISGSRKNAYLYDWFQLAYKTFPNALYRRMQLKNFFDKPVLLDSAVLMNKEHFQELDKIEQKSMSMLKKSGIKDSAFVETQRILIKYHKIFTILTNYEYARTLKISVPNYYLDYLKSYKFTDFDVAQHPDFREIMRIYFKVHKNEFTPKEAIDSEISYNASLIPNQQLREYYTLDALAAEVLMKNYFHLRRLAEKCAPVMVTDEGKARFAKLFEYIKTVSEEGVDGQMAPDFAYESSTGSVVKLSDFKGHYVLIDVWATWCGPCKQQLPHMKEMEKELGGRNLEFVSISVDLQSNKNKWKKLVAENDMKGHCLIADQAFNSKFIKFFDIKAIPRFILIAPDGRVLSSQCNMISDKNFQNYLRKLVK